MKVNKWIAGLATGSVLAVAVPVSAQFSGLKSLKKAMETVAKELEQPQPTARPSPPQSVHAQIGSESPKLSLIGEWMAVGEKCLITNPDDYTDGANLRIEKESISGFEWGCDLKPAIAQNAWSYSGKKVCMGDGQDDTPLAISLDLQSDGDILMKDENGTQTLHRCGK